MEELIDLGEVNQLKIGLSWDMYDVESSVDLDASCVFFDEFGEIKDVLYYNQLNVGYAEHSGDNRTGEGEGFDETILINTVKMEGQVKCFMILVNCYKGGSFMSVETANIKMLNPENGEEICDLQVGCRGNQTGLMLFLIYSEGNSWKLKKIERLANGRNFLEIQNEMMEEISFLVTESPENKREWRNGSRFDLVKGDIVKIETQKVSMGLGWDRISGFKCDLDASVIVVTEEKEVDSIIYFSNKQNKNKSIVHLGDNTTGVGDGDDEVIEVDLGRIPFKIGFLIFIVNIYTEDRSFGDITGAYCRLLTSSQREICRYNLTNQKTGEAMVMAVLYRSGISSWAVKAVGEEVKGHRASDSQTEVLERLILDRDLRRVKDAIKTDIMLHEAEISSIEMYITEGKHITKYHGHMQMKAHAEHVDKMDLLGKSDPYYVIKSVKSRKIIRNSEVQDVTLNPVWDTSLFSNLEMEELYVVEVWDWDRLTSDDLIGKFVFIPQEAVSRKKRKSEEEEEEIEGEQEEEEEVDENVLIRSARFDLISTSKKKLSDPEYKNSGVFVIDELSTEAYGPDLGLGAKIRRRERNIEVVGPWRKWLKLPKVKRRVLKVPKIDSSTRKKEERRISCLRFQREIIKKEKEEESRLQAKAEVKKEKEMKKAKERERVWKKQEEKRKKKEFFRRLEEEGKLKEYLAEEKRKKKERKKAQKEEERKAEEQRLEKEEEDRKKSEEWWKNYRKEKKRKDAQGKKDAFLQAKLEKEEYKIEREKLKEEKKRRKEEKKKKKK